MAAADCSNADVLPVVFDVTCPAAANNLRQVLLPSNVANLYVDVQFPVVTDGYATYTGTDDVAAGAAIKDTFAPVARTWYRMPLIRNPALFFLGSNTNSAAAKIRLSRRG